MIKPMLCVKPEDRPEARDLKTDLEECTRRLNTQKIERCGIKTIWLSKEEKNHCNLFRRYPIYLDKDGLFK